MFLRRVACREASCSARCRGPSSSQLAREIDDGNKVAASAGLITWGRPVAYSAGVCEGAGLGPPGCGDDLDAASGGVVPQGGKSSVSGNSDPRVRVPPVGAPLGEATSRSLARRRFYFSEGPKKI